MYHGFFIYWVKYFIASKVWQLWPTINTFGDFPDGSMFKSPPSHVGDVGLIAGGGIKIPYAVGHLSAFATTTEPMFWSPSATAREMPVHRNQEIMCCKERSWVQQLRKTWCSHNFFFFFLKNTFDYKHLCVSFKLLWMNTKDHNDWITGKNMCSFVRSCQLPKVLQRGCIILHSNSDVWEFLLLHIVPSVWYCQCFWFWPFSYVCNGISVLF